MNRTGIEYCDFTWGIVHGCSKISRGCQFCWAERMSKRLAGRAGYDAEEPFKPTYQISRMDAALAAGSVNGMKEAAPGCDDDPGCATCPDVGACDNEGGQ